MTQGELEKLPGGIVRAMNRLETRIMEDVVRRIRINQFSTASADWQINRLMQLGLSQKEIRKWVQQALEISEKEINRIFSDETYTEYMKHSRAYEMRGVKQIPFDENQRLQQLIEAVRIQTNETFRDMSGSLGFVKEEGPGRLKNVELTQFYQETLDDAVMDLSSGAFDYNTVLNRTINDMTRSGLRWIDYKTGHHNRVPVAARRAVLTGWRQVQGEISEQTARDLGTDSFEVTMHAGARPTHQEWEGKIYTKEQLISVCGLGEVTGLHGANCYHDYYPFIPGVDIPTYTEEQLNEIHERENTPKDYYGKQYTTYEALQRQRQLETRIRKYREDIHLLNEGMEGVSGEEAEKIQNAITLKKAKCKGLMQQYVDFSDKMDLPMQKERIYQDGLKVNIPERNFSKVAAARS